MLPNKFNMVDMGGIDIVESQGIIVDGLYARLLASISQCRYSILYNWKFDGILIPPTTVELNSTQDSVKINNYVEVTNDDVVHIYSLEPHPVIEEITITENGTYSASLGIDGYSPIYVDVESGVPLVTESYWNSLTAEEKREYNLVAIESNFSGYNRGSLVYGAEYTAQMFDNGWAKTSKELNLLHSSKQLVVIAINTEASTKQNTISVLKNSVEITEDFTVTHEYTGSGTNRRNYRISVYSDVFSVNDVISITVSNGGNYTSFVYFFIDDTAINGVAQAVTTNDAIATGSFNQNSYCVYGIITGANSGAITDFMLAPANYEVTTSYPGGSYSCGFIFWFN